MSDQTDAANTIVKKYALFSLGGGFIPAPKLDLLLIATSQALMLRELAKEYDVPFSKNLGKSAVSSLLGGYLPTRLGLGGLGSLVKAVPVVGTYIGFATVPAFATATTYAIGKVFIQHFESGGTFLDFDPEKVRAHFAAEMDKSSSKADAA
ncbi:MAG: DUF697 domain-containing protein [Vicinamibacterales bacterium]|jgi:uncharacterized protein (DUF697 family)|nr:DUF697 domain-containing protein [Vicinamibacterales bacterium]